MPWKWVSFFCLCGWILACSRLDAQEVEVGGAAAAPSKGDLALGKKLFLDHCAMCHGKEGLGNGPLASAIPNIANLTSSRVQDKSNAELFDVITQGKSPMPSFKSLSKMDRWALVDYVRAFAEKDEPHLDEVGPHRP